MIDLSQKLRLRIYQLKKIYPLYVDSYVTLVLECVSLPLGRPGRAFIFLLFLLYDKLLVFNHCIAC